LGEKIDHDNLSWSRGFPFSHDFHLTSNHLDKKIYIAIPKADDLKKGEKRPHDNTIERPGAKKSRVDRQPHGSMNGNNHRVPPLSPSRQLRDEMARNNQVLGTPAGRQKSSPITPVPKGGFRYRY
jgi:hypothetical protein